MGDKAKVTIDVVGDRKGAINLVNVGNGAKTWVGEKDDAETSLRLLRYTLCSGPRYVGKQQLPTSVPSVYCSILCFFVL